MIFVMDNYDSFTYNLVQYLGELGAELVVKRNDKTSIKEIEGLNPERIVISPGPKTPKEAGLSNDVIKHFHDKVPILGVCLGHQCIGYTFGGEIIRAPQLFHGKTSAIEHFGDPIFKDVENPFIATRYHSLIINPPSRPECLQVIARTEDGIIMGVKHKIHKLYGLQFHPESIMTEAGKKILGNFLEL